MGHDGPLSNAEKKRIILTEFFNPVISGAFYYYCWKNSLPIKAKQANIYAWCIFGIQLLLVPLLGFGVSLIK
jgi:hypothetical protein